MKKVWRCEIAALSRAERKLRGARRRRERDTASQVAVLRRDCERRVKDLERSARQDLAASSKRLAVFQLRRAVLAGRLSGENASAHAPSAH